MSFIVFCVVLVVIVALGVWGAQLFYLRKRSLDAAEYDRKRCDTPTHERTEPSGVLEVMTPAVRQIVLPTQLSDTGTYVDWDVPDFAGDSPFDPRPRKAPATKTVTKKPTKKVAKTPKKLTKKDAKKGPRS